MSDHKPDLTAEAATTIHQTTAADLECRPGYLLIGHKIVSIADVLASRESRRKWLSRSHGLTDAVRCLCATPCVPMGVKHYATYGTYSLYHLARNDPARHAPGCIFHFVPGSRCDPRETVHDVTPSVLQDANGVHIRPSWSVWDGPTKLRRYCRDHGANAERFDGLRVSENGASLRTLLEILWQQAGLCYWHPSLETHRTYATVTSRLARVARSVFIEKHNLASLLYIPPPYHPSAKHRAQSCYDTWFLYQAARSETTGKMLVQYVLGICRAIRHHADQVHVLFKHTTMRLPVPLDRWTSLAHLLRIPDHAHQADTVPSWPIVFLAAVRCETQRKNDPDGLMVRELTAIHLSDDECWIPCESGHERRLIQRLVADRRIFIKPLQAGRSNFEARPDIVLLDRQDRCCLEVLGYANDPQYAARWLKKSEKYARHGQAYWTWDPHAQPAIPTLPSPEKRHRPHDHDPNPATLQNA
ncbi:MAG: DUF1173 domain-containing protein [candidate division KSB1 bacterium]|nr:DUF1173 domain-containing protein [candidate division KSB1 bacterium]